MIFLTVGTQLPFERLVKCVDKFCQINPKIKVIGQIAKSQYKPLHFENHETLTIPEFSDFFDQAEIVISHAGMGSILTALCAAKPILIMPRLTEHSEHRNDHQVGTAEKFGKQLNCSVFNNFDELNQVYQRAISVNISQEMSPYAPAQTLLNLKKILT
jgi:UDP-N-acetylglucosamine transferase subunit ALG13